jgi:hypothetical protein
MVGKEGKGKTLGKESVEEVLLALNKHCKPVLVTANPRGSWW